MLASLMVSHGIRHAVVSPGSRNAPLLVALERQPEIDSKVVIDERSAAFIGLGISAGLCGEPVALICTSGTAPLNYGPALAEAFYRNIPLIAVTADRPEEWIDQDDSQTIVQPGIFRNFTKGTFDIPVETDEESRMWMINRKLNDALTLAKSGIPGPVHINIRLDEPLGLIEDIEEPSPRMIESTFQKGISDVKQLCEEITSGARVMILCGFLNPGNTDTHLKKLASLPNVIVVHEAQSNLHGEGVFIPNIDATLSRIKNPEAPEVVITLGGSLTSRKIKTYLRGIDGLRHWSIGLRDYSVDCFKKLTNRIISDEECAIEAIANAITVKKINKSVFKEGWEEASRRAFSDAEAFAAKADWSDFKASSYIISNIPEGWNLQLSNGTSVRYAQLFDYSRASTIYCNRGVSGIDGCTSTAIGAATTSDRPTLLLTGDMSMQYDMGALATTFIPRNFKIVVLNNGGGGIFRFIPSTKHLDELKKYFVCDVRLPLMKLAEAYGFRYLYATSFDDLKKAYREMIDCESCPVILDVRTDGEVSAEYISAFLSGKC